VFHRSNTGLCHVFARKQFPLLDFPLSLLVSFFRVTCPPETSPTAQGVYPFKVVYSSITETESMEESCPDLFWINGRKARHQFQINREN
jgi:hypothetical protein